MRRKILTGVLGTLVVGVMTVALVVSMAASDRPERARPAEADPGADSQAEQPVAVEVAKPTRRPLTRELRMPATLRADERVDLYAKTSGYVADVLVDIGSRVGAGDVLLRIDVPEMMDELRHAGAVLGAKRAGVEALKAKVSQLALVIESARGEVARFAAERQWRQITLQRTRELREGNAIPEQALDDAKSRLAIAEAQLAVARARAAAAEGEKRSAEADVEVAESEVVIAGAAVVRLETLMEYATIRAPFEGVITERLVDPGAFVRSAAEGTAAPLLRLAKTDRLRLVLEIPEPDVPFVRAGTEVDIHVKALGGEPFRASVTRTAGALKADTRTMRVEADLDNQDGRLAPGMYAKVVVKLETNAQALVVPSKAVRVRGREVSVLVANDRVAKSVPVEVGYDDGIWAEIVRGLEGDEWVITGVNNMVAPGAPVTPVPVDSSGT